MEGGEESGRGRCDAVVQLEDDEKGEQAVKPTLRVLRCGCGVAPLRGDLDFRGYGGRIENL